MRRRIVAGNWKMNMTPSEAVVLCEKLKGLVNNPDVDVVYCVPAIDTGEISAAMLKDAGVSYVILGHSERRMLFGETDEAINKKMKKAIEYDLTPIMCCGETLKQREDGITLSHIRSQVKAGFEGIKAEDAENCVIAYEPIWAIGTGKTATSEQAEEVCRAIRECIAELYGAKVADKLRVQYGGSVNASNAAELFNMPDIDGGLVGGASLKEEFGSIVNA